VTHRSLSELLGVALPREGGDVVVSGTRFIMRGGILRSSGVVSSTQAVTSTAFGYKWARRSTFESARSRAAARAWLLERYGDVAGARWWGDYDEHPLLLDAGCGAAFSALELFGDRLRKVRYLGVDVSEAVDVAAERFAERDLPADFLQADLLNLPFPDRSIDVMFSEGVLHHTDSTREALFALVPLLRPGGRLLFYVYRRKGPIREFTDDYVRDKLRDLPPDAVWEALRSLTQLGIALGELDVMVDVGQDVELLDIPAGRYSVQRLLYWHVLKAFYRPGSSLEELNHVNFDWYAPANAHRQSPEEVRAWCEDAGLDIERELVDLPGITVIARRRG
jgi:SAM-dependent methyltransferase